MCRGLSMCEPRDSIFLGSSGPLALRQRLSEALAERERVLCHNLTCCSEIGLWCAGNAINPEMHYGMRIGRP